ncbi:PPOX class F420-dependent oxidoreductase [Actinomadura barringtoniae]|uniref:PPOX class F420-dependent oxidoreductase n=1 Tax=Actinomadura barringtoniae TaxID=1427535 RepID=A0A939PT63_9ACTN|nr:PPOX class F420-dependent oxidoreductase [Actinomadura barringtoniae]MBO2455789.1 PPOX class F420-dependent oxidoreductase [Actinomadura barringtoniae]
MSLTDEEHAYVESQPLGRLATVGPKGDPQNNPVGVFYNDETGTVDIYGHGLAGSRKFRNVQKNDQVAIVVDDLASTDPWTVRGIEIRGRAEALTGIDPPMPGFSPDVIRIHPRTIFSWGINAGEEGMVKRTVG